MTRRDGYRLEAKLWRKIAVVLLQGVYHPNEEAFVYGKDDWGLCGVLREVAVGDLAGLDMAPLLTLNRMRSRLKGVKPRAPRGKARGYWEFGFWWPVNTNAGRDARVRVALKMAAKCDALAGDL